ncbi:MAG: Ig-like domain-containing protein, partial [bacterium]
MFKRLFLMVVMELLVTGVSLSTVYGAGRMLPGCEIGDALFGQINFWGIPLPPGIARLGHAGLYYCSSTRDGSEAWDPEKADLVNSNMEFATIEAIYTLKGVKVQISKLTDSFSNQFYSGAYNKSGGLTEDQRKRIVTCAFKQRDAKATAPFPWTRKWPAIKDPNHKEVKDRAFSCDGIVEYCYEQVIKPDGFFNEEDEKDCAPKVKITEIPQFVFLAKGKLPKFYPVGLMKKMTKATSHPPKIINFKVEKDGKEIKERDRVKGMVKIKTMVTDTEFGSGVDKVEFYARANTLPLPDLIHIKTEDKPDADIGRVYECDWNTPGEGVLPYNLHVVAYDRAGNKTQECKNFWFDSPYHVEDPFEVIIDNEPPQVATTTPSNGATKIYLGKKIRVTFSEEMATETINSDTILVNNSAIVGSVTYAEDLRTAFFIPDKPLDIYTNYTVLVKSGELGVKDSAGNPMDSDYSFSFTTTDELIPGKVVEVPVTYTDEYGNEHPVPAGTRVMVSYWLIGTEQEDYIIGTGKYQGVEEDGKVRFNWPGGAIENQRFRVFYESWGFRTDWMTPSPTPNDSSTRELLNSSLTTENSAFKTDTRFTSPSIYVTTKPDKWEFHKFASWLFDIHKPEGSDVYVPVNGTVTINYDEVVTIPWWSKVYYNRTGALSIFGALNSGGFDYMANLYPGMKVVDEASWWENINYSPEGITCYGTNTKGIWKILVNGIKKDEWSDDKILSAFGNLLIKRWGENFYDFQLRLRPKFGTRTDVFQAWLNGFSFYYSCVSRGTATIEVRDVDTGITNTYNLESLGSETQGLDNGAAVAAALWKMKDPYHIWKAIYNNIIIPAHPGSNVQDFWRELGTQSYIPMPEQFWLMHGLKPKIEFATSTNTPNPRLFWDRNGILDNTIAVTYTLEIATDTTFENILFSKHQITEENYHLTDINLEDGIYYWRVRVEDEYLPGNLQNALIDLYSPTGNFEIHLSKQAGITVINDPNTQGIPSDVIVGIYDKEGSIYTGAYWIEYDQINRTKTLDLKYTPITVHFEAQGSGKNKSSITLPPDYTFEDGSCVHIFENGITFNEPGSYTISISLSGEGINIPAASHGGIQVAPKGIVPDHFHVVDILDPIEEGGTSNVSVVVHDANCNLVIGYTGDVYFTSTDPLSILPQTYTFTASDYGVRTFVDGVVLKTSGSQTVFATDVDNPQIIGSQSVFVGTPTTNPRIFIQPTAGTVGIGVSVTGVDFPVNEVVAIDFGITASIVVTTTDGLGQFNASFVVDTQAGCGSITVVARSKDCVVSDWFRMLGRITLVSPQQGTIGTVISVSGDGFAAKERIEIDFGTNPTITVTWSDNAGRFWAVFTADTQPGCGTITVSAKGKDCVAYSWFRMLGRITLVSPQQGTVGTIVAVGGDGFAAKERIEIDFGTNPTITVTWSDNAGRFWAVFTADTQAGCGTITVSAKGKDCVAYSWFRMLGRITLVSPQQGTIGTVISV